MTQNAVDWFFEQAVKLLKNPDDIESLYVYHFVAKQMFKDQIEKAHCHNRCVNNQSYECTANAIIKAKRYYKETYEDNE